MELPLLTPSPDHTQFDQICAEVDEFEPLPTLAASVEADQQSEEESALDSQILAGLVSPC